MSRAAYILYTTLSKLLFMTLHYPHAACLNAASQIFYLRSDISNDLQSHLTLVKVLRGVSYLESANIYCGKLESRNIVVDAMGVIKIGNVSGWTSIHDHTLDYEVENLMMDLMEPESISMEKNTGPRSLRLGENWTHKVLEFITLAKSADITGLLASRFITEPHSSNQGSLACLVRIAVKTVYFSYNIT